MAALILVVTPGAGQSAVTLTADARFTKAPRGAVLGTLLAGLEVRPGRTSGAAVEVAFEGWLPTASLGPFKRDGFDAVLNRRGGESLRLTPEGSVVARLSSGVGFVKVDTRGTWTRVRRTAWIEQKALPAAGGSAAAAAAPPSGPDRGVLARKAPLAVSAGGAVVGSVDSGVPARVIARAAGWTRLQLEVWVPDSLVQTGDSGVLRGVSVAEVRANPARYVGQVVEWRVQFVAVQKADELRPEIPLGQAYLLTRGPLPEPGFVYVVVPSSQVARFEAVPALKELTLRGTIRAAATKYLPTPVLDLVQVMAGVAN
ncbi:MAG: hypothetical protein U0104_03290 [Gemmatimonadales bacterium]